MREAKKIFSGVGAAYALFMAVSLGGQLLFGVLVRLLSLQRYVQSQSSQIIVSSVIMYGMGGAVCLWRMKKIPVCEALPDQKLSKKMLAAAMIISISMVYLGNILGQFLMKLFDLARGTVTENPVAEMISELNLGVTILAVVIIAPLAEEFLFRKMLLDRIRRYGDAIAMVVSGLTFGLMHGNFFQFFYAFALGCISAYLYLKSGRLRYSVIFHMIVNFMGSVVSVLLLRMVDMETLEQFSAGNAAYLDEVIQMFPAIALISLYTLLLFGVMIAGIILLICLRKKITFQKGDGTLEKGYEWSAVLLNAGMIVYFICAVVMFAM